MKVVILAGGKGTRFSGLTEFVPKPLIDVNGKPIITKNEVKESGLITQLYNLVSIVGIDKAFNES